MIYIFGVLSALSFYLIPFIVGFPLVCFVKKLNKHKTKHNLSSRDDDITAHLIIVFFESFVLGSLLIYAIYYFLYLIGIKPPMGTNIIQLISGIFAMYVLKIIHSKHKPSLNFSIISISLVLFAMSVLSYFTWRHDSPINTTLDWDLYTHQTAVNIISSGTFSFFTSALSDTFRFNAYPTFFHVLIAIPQQIFKPDVLHFWWFVQFFHLITVAFASYLLGYILSKNRFFGFISAVFGVFTFESFAAYTAFFLIPQNLAATLVAVFLARVIYKHSLQEKQVEPITLLFALYILLNHTIIGSFGLAVLAFSIVFLNRATKHKTQTLLLVTAFIMVVLVPVIASKLDLGFINRGEAQHFNFSLNQKIALARDFYGYFFFILFPLGLFYLIQKRNSVCTLFSILSLGILAVVLSPLPYSMKFYSVGRFVVHAVMASGVWLFVRKTNDKVKTLATILLILSLCVVLIFNLYSWKQTPTYGEISTHVSKEEINAAKFLKQNYAGQNILLVSEPATMFILEGLSEINSQGGAYTDLKTRQILSDLYLTRSKENLLKLFEIKDLVTITNPNKLLFVIGGRFKQWEELENDKKFGIYWNIWTPSDLSVEDEEFIEFVRNSGIAKEVYKNPGLIIFELSR